MTRVSSPTMDALKHEALDNRIWRSGAQVRGRGEHRLCYLPLRPPSTASRSPLSRSLSHRKWAAWLDASSASADEAALPESIQEIIAAGGVDPREWVAEWMEEILSLGVGVVAQRYVARRMGVGEGGLGRGKRKSAR